MSVSGTVLDALVAGVREDLSARMSARPHEQMVAAALSAAPARPVLARWARAHLAVIAEVKRASPSKGALAAISVLTEQRRFGGSLADLDAVRAAVDLPVLRKDFMVTDYQFYEARAHGADLVLLIVAALSDDELSRFHTLATELGMTALVEVHDERELERALQIGPDLIGVNARNLLTLDVDRDAFPRLVAQVPPGIVTVAESGIRDASDAQRYAAQGARAVLVGEALVRDGDPSAVVRAMSGIPLADVGGAP